MTVNGILWFLLGLEQTIIVICSFRTLYPEAEDSESDASIFSGRGFQYNPVSSQLYTLGLRTNPTR